MIIGIDEAGRGPLAGPVTAAAVVLGDDCHIDGLNDSKKLTPKKREALAPQIMKKALFYKVVDIDVETIDRINILQATFLAMKEAFEGLNLPTDEKIEILVDGNKAPDFALSAFKEAKVECIVKGDAKIPEIMAASILAKTHRDGLMVEYGQQYPNWQFEKHKGYGTQLHLSLCQQYGRSPIHRKTFTIKAPKGRQ